MAIGKPKKWATAIISEEIPSGISGARPTAEKQ
jgi:hypothetical protein